MAVLGHIAQWSGLNLIKSVFNRFRQFEHKWQLASLISGMLAFLASATAVVTLGLQLNGQRDAADVTAWQLLNSYNDENQYNSGQIFALETLVQDSVSLYNFGGGHKKMWLVGAKLNGAQFHHANLQDFNFTYAELRNAWLKECQCKGANFYSADLSGARIALTDFGNVPSNFARTDVSDISDELSEDEKGRAAIDLPAHLFDMACWRKGHRPRLINKASEAALPTKDPDYEKCRSGRS